MRSNGAGMWPSKPSTSASPCTVVRVLLVCISGTTAALELRPPPVQRHAQQNKDKDNSNVQLPLCEFIV